MKTILYFQSSYCESNNAEAEGAFAWAKSAKWNVQAIPYANAAKNLQIANDRIRKKPPIGKLVAFWNADGAIVDCGAAVGLLRPRDFGKLPVVFLDCPPMAGAVRVRSDGRAVGECAARELLALGFPRYAYIPWIKPLDWSRERGDVFLSCVRMNGHPTLPFDWKGANGEDAMRRVLSDWIAAAPRPLAIFAANDYIASLVVTCANRAHLRVPEELAVLGVDDDVRVCTCSQPTISSIHMDFERAGWSAAMLLDQMMRQPGKAPAGVTFGVARVSRRESTKVQLRRDKSVDGALSLIRRAALDGITAADVIAQSGFSRRLLEMRFREATGHSILQEIRSVRISCAKRLLEYTSASLPEIARQCGYQSVVTFRTAFITEVGQAPRTYRMKLRHGTRGKSTSSTSATHKGR